MEDSDIEKKKKLFSLTNTKHLNTSYNVKSYFENDEEIQFTKCTYFRTNAKFLVNDNEHFEIWYSQLCEPLYIGSMSSCLYSVISFKDGRIIAICELKPNDFWQLISGRKFRVEVRGQGFGPDNDHVKCVELNTFKQIYQYVEEHLNNNDLEPISGMLRPRIAYSFIEI